MQVRCSMRSIRAAIRRAHREHPPGLRGDPHPCLFPRAVMRRRPVVRYVPFPLVVTAKRHVERPEGGQGRPEPVLDVSSLGVRERRIFRYAHGASAHAPMRGPRGSVLTGYPELDVRFILDDRAREFVRANPDGATIDDVAEVLQIGKSTVDGLEKRAFAKLREAARTSRLVRKWLVDLAHHVGMHAVAEEYQGHA